MRANLVAVIRAVSFVTALVVAVAAGAAADSTAEPAVANGAGEEKVLSWRGYVSQDVVPAGSSAEVAVVVELQGSWHINAAKPADPMLIPTTLTLAAPAGLTLADPVFPEPKRQKFAFSEEPLLVYEGKIAVRVTVTVDAAAEAGEVEVLGTLRYQACDNQRCLAPRKERVGVTVMVGASSATPKRLHPEVFGGEKAAVFPPGGVPAGSVAVAGLAPAGRVAAAAAPADGDELRQRLGRLFSEGSHLLAFGIIFLTGLGLSFTPCVYPVIPITIGYFANQSERRGGKTASLAVVYVLGMATMYSVMGVVAALLGKPFGSYLASPWVLAFEAAVMVALATSMFGLWEFGVPTFLATRLGASPSGHAGALFMGLTVGIVAAPCIGPAILALFTLVALLGSVVQGFLIFFVFALGLGFPFLILGSMSGAMSKLPRSGEWMVWVKHLFGFLLLGMALYFLRPLPGVGGAIFMWGAPLLALVAGVYLGFLDPVGRRSAGFRRFKMVTGVVLVALSLGGLLWLRPAEAEAGHAIVWQDYEDAAFAAAVAAGRPVLLDFTAEWCIPCKELERFTFSDPEVVQAAGRFAAFRADGTVDGQPLVAALQSRFDVRGYPTVLFLDARGVERSELRVVGFVGAEEFRSRLERVD